MKHKSQQFLQRRKFLMVVPLLILPFVTMIFWALGGGQVAPARATALNTGLNLNLPSAQFPKRESLNKLGLYEKAKSDSLKFKEARENDPYFDIALLEDSFKQDSSGTLLQSIRVTRNAGSSDLRSSVDENEIKVNAKLEEITRELSKPATDTPKKERQKSPSITRDEFGTDVDRLEAMMTMMQKDEGSQREMAELSGVLDKILDIQQPDRQKERLKDERLTAEKGLSKVNPITTDDDITLMSTNHDLSDRIISEDFFDLDINANEQAGNAIQAVVHDTQIVSAGSTLKLRLLEDVMIDGVLVRRDQFIYGSCDIDGERVTVSINSIRQDNSLFTVKLNAYDLDGMEGIFIPGAISRDVAKQSSDQALQSMQFLSLDHSLQAQAASAGIQAAKGLFSKKVKAVRVTIKAGYQILLRDTNSN